MPHLGIFPPHCFLTVWRSKPSFIHGLRHSEPSSVLDRRSESPSQFWRSKSSPSLFSFGVQSHHRFFRSTFRVASSVSTFRVVITSQFDVQSHHHHFSISAFRAIIGFLIDIQSPLLGFRRSESLSLLSFGVQSHHHYFS